MSSSSFSGVETFDRDGRPIWEKPKEVEVSRMFYCLVVDIDILRQVFGERFWNDTEDIRCVPTARITVEEDQKLIGFGVRLTSSSGHRRAQYLVSEG